MTINNFYNKVKFSYNKCNFVNLFFFQLIIVNGPLKGNKLNILTLGCLQHNLLKVRAHSLVTSVSTMSLLVRA